MKKIQINVDEEVYERYQEICRKKGTSVAVSFRDGMKEAVIRSEYSYVNEQHRLLDEAMNAIMALSRSIEDEKVQNDVMSIKTSLMIVTLDKLGK